MKIIDCTTYYNEDLMLEVRFNIMNKYVDKFIVVESKYQHRGNKKKLNFNINKFSEFKKKIIYKIVEEEPKNIIYKEKNNVLYEEEIDKRSNSIKRIKHQRDSMMECLNFAEDDDYIFYSDNDEIPNLENFNFESNKNKILIFKQKLFYYKFNLFFNRIDWYGTKACKKKDLISLSWLRDIKSKKYAYYRFDTIFSKTKYRNVKIINDGGWHFSQLKNPHDLEMKLLNQEHHDEYKLAKEKLPTAAELIKRKIIVYAHHAKSTDYKFSKEFKLKTVSIDTLPSFLRKNVSKYSDWFDLEK